MTDRDFSNDHYSNRIDEDILDSIRGTVKESLESLSKQLLDTLNLFKLILDECCENEHGQKKLKSLFKPTKLELWTTYLRCLTRKINVSFSELKTHAIDFLREDVMEKFQQKQKKVKPVSCEERLKKYPRPKNEVAFLLNFINYNSKNSSGILEHYQRPDGGSHVKSQSTAEKKPNLTIPPIIQISPIVNLSPPTPRTLVIEEVREIFLGDGAIENGERVAKELRNEKKYGENSRRLVTKSGSLVWTASTRTIYTWGP